MNPIEQIAIECGGAKRTTRGIICGCPAHEDRTSSLSVGYGDHSNVLIHCFAGREANSVISALRARDRWPMQPMLRRPPLVPATTKIITLNPDRTTTALRIWAVTHSAKTSLVQTYLARRGITTPEATGFVDPQINGHRETWPIRVHLFRNRLPTMHRDGWAKNRGSNSAAFAGSVWERGYMGNAEIDRMSWNRGGS